MKMPSGIEFKHHYYLKQYYKPIFELQLVLLKKKLGILGLRFRSFEFSKTAPR